MKFALTGHTRGFGKYILEKISKEHEVKCFSKSTGFDITKKDIRTSIVDQIDNCDVFINCAQQGYAQIELLYDVFYSWAEKPKLILNIGSNARDFTNRDRPYDYAIQKLALNHASKQLGRSNICKVVTVDFGFLIRDEGSTIGYESAFEYVEIALNSLNKKHRLLEILVAHD